MKNLNKLFLIIAILLPTAAFARSNLYLYLYEEILAQNDLDMQHGYCITWVNASMPNYSALSGTNAAQYSCSIDFEAREINDPSHTAYGNRSVVYHASPEWVNSPTDWGKKLNNSYGQFGGIFSTMAPGKGEGLDTLAFAVPNGVLHGIYATASLLSDVVYYREKEKAVTLLPKFSSLRAAQMAACHVIALELVDNVCQEKLAGFAADIDRKIKGLEQRQDLLEQMVPIKPNGKR